MLERQADERQPDDNAAAPREQRRAGRAEIFARDGGEPEHPGNRDRDTEGNPARHHRGFAAAAARREAGREDDRTRSGGTAQPVDKQARPEARAGRAAEAGEERRARQGAPPHRCADPREGLQAGQGSPTRRPPRATWASAAPDNDTNYRGRRVGAPRAPQAIRRRAAPASATVSFTIGGERQRQRRAARSRLGGCGHRPGSAGYGTACVAVSAAAGRPVEEFTVPVSFRSN